MNLFRTITTTLLIAAFAAFVAFLLNEVAVSEVTWGRYVYLLSGFEAIVFAAVGWMFGKEVHRERAEKAEEKGTQAVEKQVAAVTEAATEKQKGLGLAQAIVAHADEAPGRLAALGVPAGEAHGAEMAPLATLARATYPEVS
jgi:hypothetical protein